jgi:hypothetical protein
LLATQAEIRQGIIESALTVSSHFASDELSVISSDGTLQGSWKSRLYYLIWQPISGVVNIKLINIWQPSSK